jgi:hypothetical protein
LKQFLMTLVCASDGGVPLWLQVASGNEHDAQQFAGVMKAFGEQWTSDGLFVMDAAFYTESNLQQVGSMGWLSRVPLTLKAAQELVHSDVTTLVEVPCDRKDYRMWEVEQTYGGVPQRWILVESQTRKADAAALATRVGEAGTSAQPTVETAEPAGVCLQTRCARSLDAVSREARGASPHSGLVQSVRAKRAPGRPAKSAEPTPVQGYRLQATLDADRHR